MPYVTPDTPPEDTVCRVLRIPNDKFWLSLVDGAISELTRPFRFEQLGTATPQETADRFQQMYDDYVLSECEDIMGCCYDVVQYRINPTTGRLELSTDGGTTWQPDPKDPAFTTIQMPPPVIDETHTKCDAATNGKQHIDDMILATSSNFDTATTVLEFIAACVAVIAAAIFAPEAEPVLLPILASALAALFAFGKTAYDAYWTTDEKDKILCALYCNIGDDGTFTEGGFEAFLTDIGSRLTAGVPRDMLYRQLVTTGRAGLNNLCSYGSSADADCSSCDCAACPALFADFGTLTRTADCEYHVVGVLSGGSYFANINFTTSTTVSDPTTLTATGKLMSITPTVGAIAINDWWDETGTHHGSGFIPGDVIVYAQLSSVAPFEGDLVVANA